MTAADARFSVIVPAYNAGRYLAEAVDSALAQTRPAHELIVVDDGSTDDTAAVAARYRDRVRYVRQPNAGVSAARNHGLRLATGNWVALLDADDAWHPAKLERTAAAVAARPDAVGLFTDFELFGGRTGAVRPSREFAGWDPAAELLVPIVSVMPSAAAFRADVPVRFPEWTGNNEDAIFFNELSDLGPVLPVAEVLTRYRRHPASAQAQAGSNRRGFDALHRWAAERADGGRTLDKLLATYARLTVQARWKRAWGQYWVMRELTAAHWPADRPKPPVLSERVLPPAVYRLKDAADRLLLGR